METSIPENGTANIGLGGEDRSREAVCPGSEPVASRNDTEFVLVVCNDLSQFCLDVLGLCDR